MAASREPYTVSSPPATATERSPWHSPVPYLFGGLAAMLGLIAFALLILACSYWKLSGHLENNENERDLEAGEETEDGDQKKGKKVYEEKVLVIMAGQVKPTFLATPVSSSRTSSFGDERTCCCGEKLEDGKQGNGEEEEEEEEQSNGNRGSLGNEELPPSTAAEVAAVVETTSHH
ncbi:Protein GLUTAMINE DUMPER 3 [Linum perenne]